MCAEPKLPAVGVGISQFQHCDQNSPRNIFILGFATYMVRFTTQRFLSPSVLRRKRMDMLAIQGTCAVLTHHHCFLQGLSVPYYFTTYTATNNHGPVNTSNQSVNGEFGSALHFAQENGLEMLDMLRDTVTADIFNSIFETGAAVALIITMVLDNTIPGKLIPQISDRQTVFAAEVCAAVTQLGDSILLGAESNSLFTDCRIQGGEGHACVGSPDGRLLQVVGG